MMGRNGLVIIKHTGALLIELREELEGIEDKRLTVRIPLRIERLSRSG
jgi:hypothetical protein